MKGILVAGVFWLPVFFIAALFDLPGWIGAIFVLPFALGMTLIEYGTKQGWFS